MHVAAANGYANMVEYLVDKGADFNSTDSEGKNSFYWADFNGHLSVVNYFIDTKGVSYDSNFIDKEDVNHDHNLLNAAQGGHLGIIKRLLEQGAALKVKDDAGNTLLHLAASGGHLNLVDYLIRGRHIGLNIKNNAGKTPLHVAASNGHLNIVEYLGNNKYAGLFNIEDNDGKTPLAVARENNHSTIIAYLEEIDSNMLMHAAKNGDLAAVKRFIEEGLVDVNVKESMQGGTVLHYAADSSNLALVQWLVEKGADIKAKKSDDSTVLHSAAAGGHLAVVKWLVEKGADVKEKDNNGDTVLHSAAEKGNLAVVQFLVEKGADVKAKITSDGYYKNKTPVDMTFNSEIKTFLQNAMNNHQRGRRSIDDEAMHVAIVDYDRSAAAITASPSNHVASDKQEEMPYRSTIEDNDADREEIGLILINENHTNNTITASEEVASSSASNIGKEFLLKTIENKKHTDSEEARLETTKKPIEAQIQDKHSNLLKEVPYIKETTAETDHRVKTTQPTWFHTMVHRLKNVFSTPKLGANRQGHKPTMTLPEINNAVIDNGLTLAAYAAALWFKDKKGAKNKRAYLSKLKQAETLVELDDKVTKAEKQFHSAMEKGQQAWETNDHAPKGQHMDDLSVVEDIRYLFTKEEQSAETEAHHTKPDSNKVANQLVHNMATMHSDNMGHTGLTTPEATYEGLPYLRQNLSYYALDKSATMIS